MPRAKTTATLDTAPTANPAADGLPPDFPSGPEGAETVAPEPPRRGPGRPKGSPNRPRPDVAPNSPDASDGRKGRGGRKPKLDIAANVTQTMEDIGTTLLMAGMVRQSDHLQFDGRVIVHRAPEIGEAVAAIAAENPQVRAAIERMYKTSGWAKIGLTFASVAVPIAACHGMAPVVFAAPFLNDATGPVPPPPVRPEKPTAPVDESGTGDGWTAMVPDIDIDSDAVEAGVPTWSPLA